MPWANGYKIAQKEDNIILFSTTRSPMREKLFKWVGPLVPNNLVFFAKKKSNISLKTLEDAKSLDSIGVYKDDFGELFLKEKGFVNLDSVLKNNQNVPKLLKGEIDLWIANEITGKHMIAKAGVANEIEKIFEVKKNYMYLAFSKSTADSVIKQWQNILDGIKADGTYAQIFSNWIMFSFTDDLKPKADTPISLSREERAWIKKHPIIRVAPDPDFAPFQYTDQNGDSKGLANDYLALVENKLGIRFEMAPAESWNVSLKSVKNHDADMVIVATRTPERAKYMSFTAPYVAFPDMIVTRENNPRIASVAQLHGKTLATVDGFAINDYIRKYYPSIKLVYKPDVASALKSVSMGEFDAPILNVATISAAIEETNITNLRVDGDTGFTYKLSFASRNDWPILNDLLEKGLNAITKEERKKLLHKWISISYDISEEKSDEPTVVLTDEEKVWLEQHPIITVAADPKWAPVEFFDAEGKFSGMSADYIALMQKHLGIKFHVLRLDSWDEILQKTINGEIDVLPAVARTPKRDETLLFTESYLTLPSVIIVNDKETAHLSSQDLNGKVVNVVAGYAVQEYLETGYPGIHLELVANAEEGLRQVSYGSSYAFIGSIATTSYIIENKLLLNLRVAGESGYTWDLSFANHKKAPILNRILSKGLASISKEERQAILSKWILVRKEPWRLKKEQVIGLLILAGALFVVSIIVWNRILIKKVEERTRQLHKAKAQAEGASRAKGEFLASMNHELRTPLTTVIGAAQLLEGASLDSHDLRLLREIRNAGEYLGTLIDNVLDLSHLEQGRIEIASLFFSPRQVFEETVEMLRTMADGHKIHLLLKSDQLPARIQGDPVRVRQVVTNLITNATKYAKSGQVTIKVDAVESPPEKSAHLIIAVQDSGPGIPPEKLETIFQPFERTEMGGDHIRGIGLGLAICKRLVEAMGGTMGVESKLNSGSRFWFTIPFESYSSEDKLPDEERGIPGPYDILLAEDSEANRDILTLLLENDGHIITGVENGKAALDEASHYRFDLILMDVQMPIMDGIKATTCCIRTLPDKKFAQTPIFALTAQVTQTVIDNCQEVGMNGVIAKPLRLSDLYATLSEDTDVKRNEPTKPPLIDFDLRAEYGKSLTAEQLAEFDMKQLISLEREQTRLFKAWDDGDLLELASAAHKLAGCAATGGFPALADIALRLELSGQKNDKETIPSLLEECRAVKEMISNRFLSGGQAWEPESFPP